PSPSPSPAPSPTATPTPAPVVPLTDVITPVEDPGTLFTRAPLAFAGELADTAPAASAAIAGNVAGLGLGQDLPLVRQRLADLAGPSIAAAWADPLNAV